MNHPARPASGSEATGLWTYALVPRETSRCTPGVVACEHCGRGMPAVPRETSSFRPPDLRDREVALVDPARSTRHRSPTMDHPPWITRHGQTSWWGPEFKARGFDARAPELRARGSRRGLQGLGLRGSRARGSGSVDGPVSATPNVEHRLQLHVKHQRVSDRPNLGRRPWTTAVPRETSRRARPSD